MIIAALEVSRNDSDGNELTENWGTVQIETMPSVGEILRVWRNLDWHILRITEVVHKTLPWPLPDDGLWQELKPRTLILADFVTIDIRSYAEG